MRGKEIEQIMERFDFQKVHEYMLSVNWIWAFEGVPSVQSLRKTARSLLQDVVKSPREASNSCTGGFHAHKWPWGELELIFAIEDWQQDFS